MYNYVFVKVVGKMHILCRIIFSIGVGILFQKNSQKLLDER